MGRLTAVTNEKISTDRAFRVTYKPKRHTEISRINTRVLKLEAEAYDLEPPGNLKNKISLDSSYCVKRYMENKFFFFFRQLRVFFRAVLV